MICGKNGWTFLHQVMKIVGDAQSVKVFLYEEDVNNMLIGELMKSLYKDKGLIFLNSLLLLQFSKFKVQSEINKTRCLFRFEHQCLKSFD